MNIPAGDVVTHAAPLDPPKFLDLLKDLGKRSFNGYVAWVGEGLDGLEEGVVVFLNGQAVAVGYTQLKYNKAYDGEQAVAPAMNVIRAKNVVYSVVSLTVPKVNLILAFNDKAKIRPMAPEKLWSFVPKAYSDEYVRGIIKTLPPSDIDRIRMLADYGLVGVKVDDL
ncbi:MAG: DUF2226 domain-containing protein [Candidatus Diapherotrites archaeon]|nr:DUF2226 domain-containing protein [Candidatus Diapherotrites archaeon]